MIRQGIYSRYGSSFAYKEMMLARILAIVITAFGLGMSSGDGASARQSGGPDLHSKTDILSFNSGSVSSGSSVLTLQIGSSISLGSNEALPSNGNFTAASDPVSQNPLTTDFGAHVRLSVPRDIATKAANGRVTLRADTEIPAGKIVYGTGQGFWTIDPDGNNNTQINQLGLDSTLSDDGTRYAFVALNPVENQLQTYVMNSDGSGLSPVPGTFGYRFPAWSHDGKRLLAFLNGEIGVSSTVAIFTPDGSDFQVVDLGHYQDVNGHGVEAFSGTVSWSPDDSQVVFTGYAGYNGLGIYIATASANPIVTELTSDNDAIYGFPRWSPNSSLIVVTKQVTNPGGGDPLQLTYALDANSGAETQITSPLINTTESVPVWSPDGSMIAVLAFDHTRGSDNKLVVMNADGSDRQILPAADQPLYITWSRATPLFLPPITSFSVNAPQTVGATIEFNAVTTSGASVRIQSNAIDPSNEADWITLQGGGVMTEDPAGSGNFDLSTTVYPAGSNIYFRAIASKLFYVDKTTTAQGPFTLHPITGPLPMTFTVNGSQSPSGTVADTVLRFAAVQPGNAASITTRVQYNTGDPNNESGWNDLQDFRHGYMIVDVSAPGLQFVLNSTAYPQQSGVSFRAVSSAPGYPDSTSNVVGPFDLTSSTPHLTTPSLVVSRNTTIGDLFFRAAHDDNVGETLRIQLSRTPADENSWANLPDGQSGNMAPRDQAGQFYLLATRLLSMQNVYFRAVASGGGYVDGVGAAYGPYNVIADTPPQISFTPPTGMSGSGQTPDDPILIGEGTFSFGATATPGSGRSIQNISLLINGDVIASQNSSQATTQYTTTVLGDYVLEAMAVDDLGGTTRTGTSPTYIRVVPAAGGQPAKAARESNSTSSGGKVFTSVVNDGHWGDPASWADANGNPGVPGPEDLAIITAPPGLSFMAIHVDNDVEVGSLTIAQSGILGGFTGNGQLTTVTVDQQATITGGGLDAIHFVVGSGGTCQYTSPIPVASFANTVIDNYGSFNLHGPGGLAGVQAFNNHGTTNFQLPISLPDSPGSTVSNDVRAIIGPFSNEGVVMANSPDSPSSQLAAIVKQNSSGIIAGGGGNALPDATIVAGGGGNIIAGGGGNIVAAGGGNIVAGGGGNIIAGGGGNIIAGGGGNIVAGGGGNLIGQDGSGIAPAIKNGPARTQLVSKNKGMVPAHSVNQAGNSGGFTQDGGEIDLNAITLVGPVTLNGGVISGSGVIIGDLANSGGYLSPGHSPGVIGVIGNFSQSGNGTLFLEDGGPYQNQYDQLQVSGAANLGGNLVVKLINDYAPATSDIFNPLGYGSMSGNFASTTSNASVTINGTGALVSASPGSTPTTFAEWRDDNFSVEQLFDPSISSATADPDGDGLDNLLEYALDTDPNNPASSNRPYAVVDSTYVSLVYTKLISAGDIIYSIDESTDLVAWTPVSPTNMVLSDNGLTQMIKAQVPRADAGTGNKLFLRLRIDHN